MIISPILLLSPLAQVYFIEEEGVDFGTYIAIVSTAMVATLGITIALIIKPTYWPRIGSCWPFQLPSLFQIEIIVE